MAKRSTLQRSGQAMIYNFLLNEVLASQCEPAYRFWVVAPWVTNFTLTGPYYVAFQELVETRGKPPQLFDVLRQIAANGGEVRITVGPDPAYHPPLRQLMAQSRRIAVRTLPHLHAKAYAGRYGAMDGSLNLTASGLHQNVELYTYHHDARSLAELRRRCEEHFALGEPM